MPGGRGVGGAPCLGVNPVQELVAIAVAPRKQGGHKVGCRILEIIIGEFDGKRAAENSGGGRGFRLKRIKGKEGAGSKDDCGSGKRCDHNGFSFHGDQGCFYEGQG